MSAASALIRNRVVRLISLLMRWGGSDAPSSDPWAEGLSFASRLNCILSRTAAYTWRDQSATFSGDLGWGRSWVGGRASPHSVSADQEIKTSSGTALQTDGDQTIPGWGGGGGGARPTKPPWSPHARAGQGKRQTHSRGCDLGSWQAGPVLHTPRAPAGVNEPPAGWGPHREEAAPQLSRLL